MKQSSSVLIFCVLFGLLSLFACNDKHPGKPGVLVFSKTQGYHHASIAEGNKAILKLGAEHDFNVDTTTNAAYFTDDSLQKYAAVVFLSTTGDVLNHRQEAAFERYIQAGGGFVGIHAATDTEYRWNWYVRMVGGVFAGHPPVQQAVVQVLDPDHPSTRHLPARWARADEWYNFERLNDSVKVLLSVDEQTYEGGKNGDPHPVAWFHEYDGGRAFYTGLGHTEASFSDSLFLQHLYGGIQYAIGNNDPMDYSRVRTPNVPADERFVKTILTKGTFTEPTEMTILSNLDVLISQRRGEIMLYEHETGCVRQVGYLDVYHSTNSGVNAEEGLLGIAADPAFAVNRYVYVFYSPADTSVNRLSRFEFRKDTIDPRSEKIVLQFYSQREICCHTGGSIAFGPDGLLYLSTGDNSTPFNEEGQPYVNNGFAPLDDRPGHLQYDARRSAGNTNDLRGKILRIRVKADGSYEIPEGNLFAPGEAQTRPEIYVMGNRNPYRISVDQKTGYLYWGEVGPDANRDSLASRGPRGYDEINRAKEPGFFGWPLFVGNNIPYRQYDYATGVSGAFFDAGRPVNNSRNNTGLVHLPPAQPALIWYPYAPSEDFPELGSGGRTAMAGPVYYTDRYPERTRYPEYFHAKFFFYDWVRNGVWTASFLPDGSLDRIVPFAEHLSFAAPMDMEAGPDGRLYVLEYGQGWFTDNPDAGLSRIDFVAGNLPPSVKEVSVDKVNGSLPFTVTARVEATDKEGDMLIYTWNFGKNELKTRNNQVQYTFVRRGEHRISVTVADAKGGVARSGDVWVYAGNAEPSVSIRLAGNRTFYFPGQAVGYEVMVSDQEEEVQMSNLYVSLDYLKGKDLAGASVGHQQASEITVGKNLMQNLDCKACHKTGERSVGPSYKMVAERYAGRPEAFSHLSRKIIDGGTGVWGENAMPAHPALKIEDAESIMKWILSLAKEDTRVASLPARGTIIPDPEKTSGPATILRLSATYTDHGAAGVKPLSGSDVLFLRSPVVTIDDFSEVHGLGTKDTLGSTWLELPQQQGWVKVARVDMKGIAGIGLEGVGNGRGGRYLVEVRSGGPDGTKSGEAELNLPAGKEKIACMVRIEAEHPAGPEDLYIRLKSLKPGGSALLGALRFVGR